MSNTDTITSTVFRVLSAEETNTHYGNTNATKTTANPTNSNNTNTNGNKPTDDTKDGSENRAIDANLVKRANPLKSKARRSILADQVCPRVCCCGGLRVFFKSKKYIDS
jgi:hypothetical protein